MHTTKNLVFAKRFDFTSSSFCRCKNWTEIFEHTSCIIWSSKMENCANGKPRAEKFFPLKLLREKRNTLRGIPLVSFLPELSEYHCTICFITLVPHLSFLTTQFVFQNYQWQDRHTWFSSGTTGVFFKQKESAWELNCSIWRKIFTGLSYKWKGPPNLLFLIREDLELFGQIKHLFVSTVHQMPASIPFQQIFQFFE